MRHALVIRFPLLLVLCFVLPGSVAVAAQPFTLVIQRNVSCNHGEAGGSLSIAGAEAARTLELPWRNNEQKISRVPAGSYAARIRADGDLGWRVELIDVPDRENIQLHVGNYPRHTVGCVLIGTDIASTDGTCALKQSKPAMARLAQAMADASGNGVSSQPLDIRVVIKD